VVNSDWISNDLPAGFRVVSTQQEVLPGSGESVTHILFSDGLASVSVFVAEHADKNVAERSRFGASHSYSTVAGDHRITAVGDVPAITVEQIATSMQAR